MMMVKDLDGEDQMKWGKQKNLVRSLKSFATETSTHVHLVCHSKKPDSRHPENKNWPGKYDISGAGDISNLTDNVLCMWRNIEKHDQLRAAADLEKWGDMECAGEVRKKWARREDAMLLVQKQRLTGDQPAKRLWFDHGKEGSWQYREDETGSKRVSYTGQIT